MVSSVEYRLTEDIQTQRKHAVVIGGGYIGVIQAYYLANNYRVTVIEANSSVAEETSALNGE